jgi:broad specificity phosphatase PhoE
VTSSLFLIRHGETDSNAQGRTIATTDSPLNDRGKSQAEAVGEALVGVNVGLILASPRLRCRETADAIARNQVGTPRVVTDQRLVELGLGEFEGRSVEEIRAAGLDDVFTAWRQGTPPEYPPGAELFDDVAVRMGAAFDEAATADVDVVVMVSHSHALRTLIATKVLGGAADGHRRLFLDHATVTSVFWESGTPRLAMLNGSVAQGPKLPPVAWALGNSAS